MKDQTITKKKPKSKTLNHQTRQKTKKPINEGIKLRKLRIKNFKIIDDLELEFPPPRMKGDPDVMVLGSINGLGKTSILETIPLLTFAAITGDNFKPLVERLFGGLPVDFFDLMIKAGEKEAMIEGDFLLGEENVKVSLSIFSNKDIKVDADRKTFWNLLELKDKVKFIALERVFLSLAGIDTNPLYFFPVMYFHSYRKIQEGYLQLETLSENDISIKFQKSFFQQPTPVSVFKIILFRNLASQKGLVEDLKIEDSEKILNKLNNLMIEFANVKVEQVKFHWNAVDIRVRSLKESNSYSFDGLSSGQKEIISTLFLIWYTTLEKPCIILIDEPELHLNTNWVRGIIKSLYEINPNNHTNLRSR